MEPVTDALTLDLLEWISSRPRTYAETMDAWRSLCPRLLVWEDALVAGLVRVSGDRVEVTPAGDTALAARKPESATIVY